jgi:Amt family ammonium transporter
MPLVMLGAGILWLGWFGFNAGSAFAANGTAIQAFVNTFLAAAAAGLAWAVVERIRDGHFTNLGAASGIVAGLVAITPGAGFVAGMSPIIIGLMAGVACCYGVGLKFKAGYDDSLDVVGVHFIGGLVGSLLIGFLADPAFFGGDFGTGLLFGGDTTLLVEQALANVVTIAYSFAVTFGIMKVLALTVGVRVSDDTEDTGLDLAEHGETAYTSGDALLGTSAGHAAASAPGGSTTAQDSEVQTRIL